MDIKLYDADDNELTLESVKKNVDSAHMTVEVLATKEVPVEIEYMGVPEDGYMATGEVESSRYHSEDRRNGISTVGSICHYRTGGSYEYYRTDR